MVFWETQKETKHLDLSPGDCEYSPWAPRSNSGCWTKFDACQISAEISGERVLGKKACATKVVANQVAARRAAAEH